MSSWENSFSLPVISQMAVFEPSIGDCVTVQVQGLPVPAPILDMVVVRRTIDGFGLQFADTAE